ncbi:MAG: FAD-dependent thymidylate synthase [Chloroflexota bacterium]|nr:FAD-dependent thymidylate synthase [Chloroflexota bacterium]
MTKPRRIYLLSPKDLSPETIAVTFAKTSRSPKAFDEIAAELTDERSAKFHEKWVVGYGHASVAEHAVLHLALENVSRLAIETIEGNRLASYTEKSTRYQQWDTDAFFIPDEITGGLLEEAYRETCERLFNAYERCIPKVQDWLRETQPQQEGESDRAVERRIQPAAVDICRFLLPAASLANVGVTINARALEYAICKMLSSPLTEVRQIGERVLEVGKDEAPTLIKYAGCNAYLTGAREKMREAAAEVPIGEVTDFRLISYVPDGEDHILAAILFRFGRDQAFESCLKAVRGMTAAEREALVRDLMENRGVFDQPLREFEYASMTFEVVMDQGAYFEFKRHRMMTQTVQPLTTTLGFAVPRGISESGCGKDYLAAMRQARDLYRQLLEINPDAASYIVPNGYRRRVLFTMNLRQAFHFCRLRSAENAHFSIRLVALRIAEAIRAIYPALASFMDIPDNDGWEDIQKQYFDALRAT